MSQLEKNLQFDSLSDLKSAVRSQAITSHTEFIVIKSDKLRYRVKCKDEHCQWQLFGSVIAGGPRCVVRAVGEHTCSGVQQLNNKEASARWLAMKYQDKFREHPHYKPAELIDDFRREAGVTVTYTVAYNAKEIAMAIINGDYQRGYRKLHAFCQKLLESNPGSYVAIEESGGRFYRAFFAFGACLTGFTSCRPFLGLDGTFLTGKYLGHLICATGLDATGGLYPVAFGIIDNENAENWIWFLQHLRSSLHVDAGLTFVSDRDKGLQEALYAVFPGCPNAVRVCCCPFPVYCAGSIQPCVNKQIGSSVVSHFCVLECCPKQVGN